MMDLVHKVLEYFFHLDKNLNLAAHNMGAGLYVLLFAIVFCETGLVVMPFLPGDSLLFVLGALAATGTAIKLPIIIPLLCIAANCGDLLNYTIGYHLGPRLFSKEKSLLLNKKHLLEAQAFYDHYGTKTIVIARFVPIVRTFAPFVAGIGKMRFARFLAWSIVGVVFWVVGVTYCGYFLGNIDWVKMHPQIVTPGIIIASLIPVALHALFRERKPQGAEAQTERRGFEVASHAEPIEAASRE